MTAVLEDALEFVVNEWKTLNTVASPSRLPSGHSPDNQNVWMDEKPGSVVTANGYVKLGTIPSNNPVTGLIHYFKASSGVSQIVCTDGQNVYWTTDYTNYTTIKTGLSAFFQLRGKVIRDKLWLTNGSDPVMTWDGSTLTELDGSGGTPNVPKGKFIEYFDERVGLFGIDGDLSSFRFSALTDTDGNEINPDNSVAWPSDNELQISEGDADIGTGLFVYRGYLYCSKQYTIWRIVGYDEYTYSRVKTRASTGTRFQESIQEKDNLVHFIGVDGLYVFDGEDAKRVSDIIDPASADEGVFAFRNLQQPLLNNQFWNVTDTADFVAGTVPNNLSTDNDKLLLVPADDTQDDFNNGTHSDTSADDNAGYLQLALETSGGVTNVGLGKTASISPGGGTGGIVYGTASQLTDDVLTTCGLYTGNADNLDNSFEIDLGESIVVGRVILRNFLGFREDSNVFINSVKIQINTSASGGTWVDAATVTVPSSVSGQTHQFTGSALGFLIDFGDEDVSFTSILARRVRVLINANACYLSMDEMEVYKAGYVSTGTFHSESIDFTTVPATFGALAASIEDNGESYQFFTQSSADGSTWDSAVNVSNGGAIGSTLRRFLRWGVTLNSSTGENTPVIDKVYVGSTFLSDIHDTGGDIYQWSPFQSSFNKSGQTITWYFRAAATSGGVGSESWTAIIPGAIPAIDVADTFVQIKIEMSTVDATQAPVVNSFTVNWVLNSGAGINTLQNVASIIILNRYWLAAATLGATENDLVVVLGKSTAGSPWHKKDFAFLSFCRIQDYYIAGSSTDGSIYRLEETYSKNGSAMDAYYETADFTKDGFQIKGREILITADRSGPYNLAFGYSTNGGLTYTETNLDLTRADGDSLSFTKKLNISFMADKVRFRVRINAADQPFSVDNIRLFYRLTPQRGTVGV